MLIAAALTMILVSSYIMDDAQKVAYSQDFVFLGHRANYKRVYVISRSSHATFLQSLRLYVSITPSLYNYYKGKGHGIADLEGYSKFITPDALTPIAKLLRKVYPDDEQFANGVLSFVHKFAYVKSGPKYPVETLVEGAGDCGALSLLAASIMKAGGVDVVLLYYQKADIGHLNVGVSLQHVPVQSTSRMNPKHYEYKGKKYWVAECTPSQKDWRVGDEPEGLLDFNVKIIPINVRGFSPARVSATLHFPPEPSNISKLFYNLNLGSSSSSSYQTVVARDLRTGEVLWTRNGCSIINSWIYLYSSRNQHGVHPYITVWAILL